MPPTLLPAKIKYSGGVRKHPAMPEPVYGDVDRALFLKYVRQDQKRKARRASRASKARAKGRKSASRARRRSRAKK